MKHIEADLTDDQYTELMWWAGGRSIDRTDYSAKPALKVLSAIADQQPKPPRPIKRGDIVRNDFFDAHAWHVRFIDTDGTTTLRRVDNGDRWTCMADNLAVADVSPLHFTTWLDANPLDEADQ